MSSGSWEWEIDWNRVPQDPTDADLGYERHDLEILEVKDLAEEWGEGGIVLCEPGSDDRSAVVNSVIMNESAVIDMDEFAAGEASR